MEARMKELWAKLRMHVRSKSTLINFVRISQNKVEEKRLEGVNDDEDIEDDENDKTDK